MYKLQQNTNIHAKLKNMTSQTVMPYTTDISLLWQSQIHKSTLLFAYFNTEHFFHFFIHYLQHFADYTALDGMMMYELEVIWKDVVVV